jgi:hypothetical protein
MSLGYLSLGGHHEGLGAFHTDENLVGIVGHEVQGLHSHLPG